MMRFCWLGMISLIILFFKKIIQSWFIAPKIQIKMKSEK